jgi:hypothetical protein
MDIHFRLAGNSKQIIRNIFDRRKIAFVLAIVFSVAAFSFASDQRAEFTNERALRTRSATTTAILANAPKEGSSL